MTGRLLRVIALLLPLWPTLVLAQQPKAGVVTTLHGVATVARAAAPQETPLKFKDDVFYKDRISTKENSIVRVLLGGKALVTVRELSVLAINEEPNRATVDLQSGKIALAVARKLMRPGESIEVRTPNAIASVRGTVLIVEMIGATAIFNVLTGSIAVSVPQAPSVPPVTVNAGQSVPVTGNTIGSIGAITPTATQGLSAPPQVSGPPAETQQQVNNQQAGQATALAAVAVALLPQQPTGTTGGTYSSSSDSKPPSTSNVGVNESQTSTTVTTQQQSSPPPPPPPLPSGTGPLFLVQNATVQLSAPNSGATFGTGTTQQDPEPGAIICATPPCSPIAVTTPLLTATAPTGGSISVSGTGLPVLELKNSSLSAAAPLFNVTGTTVETSTLLVMDPSSLTLGDSLLFMDSAMLTSASTLFSATGDATGKSTITATRDGVPLVKLLSSTLRLTGAGKSLLSLDHSDLTVKGPFLSGTDSTVEVNGPLLNLKNGSTATNSVGPVIKLSGGSLMADALVTSDRNGNALNATGPVLDLFNTTVQLGSLLGPSGVEAIGFTLAPGDPLARLSNSHLSLTQSGVPFLILPSGTVLNVSGTGTSLVSLDHSEMTVVGPFIQAVDADITVSGPVARLTNGSTLRNTMGPVFSLSGGSLTADALGISDSTGNKFDLTGTLLDLSNGASVTLRTLGEEVPNNHKDTVTFNLAAHEPLISLSRSHLTLTGAGKELVGFGVDTGTPITQNGVALIATGTSASPSTISLKGRLLDLGGVNLTDSQAQIQLSHTTVTQTGSDPLVDVLGLPVTMAGPLLYVGGGTNTITAGGPILHFGTGSFTSNTTDELIQIGAGDVVKSSSNFVRLDGGASVSLKGTFLNASGSTLCSGSTSTPCATGAAGNTAFMVVTGGAHLKTMGTADPLISLSGGSVTAGGNFFHVTGAGSKVDLSGRLLSSSGMAIPAGNNLVRLFDGGSLSSSTADHLLLFTGGSYTGGGTLNTASGGSLLRMFSQVNHPGTSLTLNGPYLGSSGGTTFRSKDASLFNITDGASINAGSDFALFGTGSAISAFNIFRLATKTSFMQPGQPTTFGSGDPATVNIHGTLIGGANFTFTTQNGGDFLFLHNKVTLNQTNTPKALVALTGTNPGDAVVNAAGSFLSMSADSPPPTLSLSGSLLNALNAKITTAGDFAALSDGATLTGSSADALVSLSGTTVTAGTSGTDTHFLHLSGSSSRVSLTGPGGFLSATGSSLTVKGDDFIEVGSGARLESTGSSSLVTLTNSPLTTLSDTGCDGCPQAFLHLFRAGSTVSLKGTSLLTATGSPLTVAGDLLLVASGGTLTNVTFDPAVTPSPLVQLTQSPLTIGTSDEDPHFLRVSGSSAINLAAGLLKATDSPIGVQDEFVELSSGASLTSAGSQPLVTLVRSSLATGDEFFKLSGGSVTLKGPLLSADSSPLTVGDDLVKIDSGGTLTAAGSGLPPLVSLTGGSHQIGGAVFDLTGSGPVNNPSQPLQYGGVLLETSGATLTTQNGIKIDPALLAATAPLFNFLNGSKVTSSSDFMVLTGNSSITANILPGDALIKLDASKLTVTSGSLFNVAGGSVLTVTGSLFALNNGSTLDIKNGALVRVAGGSVFTLTGGYLGVFGPTGTNALSLNNVPACGVCVSIGGGYQAVLVNSAMVGNVTVSPSFKPFQGLTATNTVKINGSTTSGGPVLIVDGTTSKVKLGF